jgi:type VI secretion system protein ImpK
LAKLSAPFFKKILEFRAAAPEQRPTCRQFRQEVIELLNEFQNRARKARLDEDGAGYFAMVALADETAMSADWAGAREWESEPLQVQYFGDFEAGDQFFHKLDRILSDGDGEAVPIYYHCLCAGFLGAKRDDPGGISSLIGRLYQRMPVLDLRDELHLTPEAYDRPLARPLMKRRFPFALAAPFILAALGLYGAYWYILADQVDQIRGPRTVDVATVDGGSR